MPKLKEPRAIARAIFDSPLKLLRLAEGREQDLQYKLAWCADDIWVPIDFAVAINSLRDWACKDIANAGKHLELSHPSSVQELTHSMPALSTISVADRKWRLNVVLEDGSRLSLDVAQEAIAVWQGFFAAHGFYD